MDRHDQELLDKQVRHLRPPRRDGVLILALVAVFFGGMALGGFAVEYKGPPVRVAANDTPAIALLRGAPPIAR
jgi:hypothetical protein